MIPDVSFFRFVKHNSIINCARKFMKRINDLHFKSRISTSFLPLQETFVFFWRSKEMKCTLSFLFNFYWISCEISELSTNLKINLVSIHTFIFNNILWQFSYMFKHIYVYTSAIYMEESSETNNNTRLIIYYILYINTFLGDNLRHLHFISYSINIKRMTHIQF